MKTRLLILLIFLLGHGIGNTIKSQSTDSTLIKESKVDSVFSLKTKEERMYTYIQLRMGLLSGFQFMDIRSDYSIVNMTVCVPLEVNVRIYPKNSYKTYFDLEAGWNNMVLNENLLVSQFAFNVGYGFFTKNFNYSVQGHVGLLAGGNTGPDPDLKKYKFTGVVGYNFETSALPVTVNLLLPHYKWKGRMLLIGIKIPLLDWDTTKPISKKKK